MNLANGLPILFIFSKNVHLVFSLIDFYPHSVVVKKDAWYSFNCLKFMKASFVIQDVIYPGEYFVCT